MVSEGYCPDRGASTMTKALPTTFLQRSKVQAKARLQSVCLIGIVTIAGAKANRILC